MYGAFVCFLEERGGESGAARRERPATTLFPLVF